LQTLHRSVKIVRLKAKVETGHGSVSVMGQFKNRVAEPEIGDLAPARRRMLKVVLESEVPLIELHRAIQIRDVDRHMVDALEHVFYLALKDKRLSGGFATAFRPMGNFARWR
jgi:hypothetical protein